MLFIKISSLNFSQKGRFKYVFLSISLELSFAKASPNRLEKIAKDNIDIKSVRYGFFFIVVNLMF